jgi:hypothetical protein
MQAPAWEAESFFDDDEAPRRIGRRIIPDRTFHRLTREMLVAHMRSGLSQGEIAARMGTSQSALSRLENAAGPKPTLATLEKFAAATNHRVEIRFVPARDGWAEIAGVD